MQKLMERINEKLNELETTTEKITCIETITMVLNELGVNDEELDHFIREKWQELTTDNS
jgi:hypothetical protein